jgi:hypothetical protein
MAMTFKKILSCAKEWYENRQKIILVHACFQLITLHGEGDSLSLSMHYSIVSWSIYYKTMYGHNYYCIAIPSRVTSLDGRLLALPANIILG